MQSDNAPQLRKLLKAKPTAEYLSISARKLWSLTRDGTLPAVRIGRSVRYDITDLQAFIEAQKHA